MSTMIAERYTVAVHEAVGLRKGQHPIPTWSDSGPMELRDAIHLAVSILTVLASREYEIRADLNDPYTWYCEYAGKSLRNRGGLVEVSVVLG